MLKTHPIHSSYSTFQHHPMIPDHDRSNGVAGPPAPYPSAEHQITCDAACSTTLAPGILSTSPKTPILAFALPKADTGPRSSIRQRWRIDNTGGGQQRHDQLDSPAITLVQGLPANVASAHAPAGEAVARDRNHRIPSIHHPDGRNTYCCDTEHGSSGS